MRNDRVLDEEFNRIFGDEKDKIISKKAKTISNWLLGEANRIINASNIDMNEFAKRVEPAQLSSLIGLQESGVVSGTMAKSVLEDMFNTGKSAEEIIQERGLSQISDTGELEAAIADVINSNVQAVSDYKAGKETALKFLVGQVMRATKGRANPVLAGDLLKKKLDES